MVDKLSTEYVYDWKLRKTKETITDPGSGAVTETKAVTVYDSETGLPTEMRQPKNAVGGGAGTTKIVYYKPGSNTSNCEQSQFAGLPCKVEPVAQPGPRALPALPIKKIASYNQLSESLEVTESPPGGRSTRKSISKTYDEAGRQKTSEITGGGVPVPIVETLYNGTNGAADYPADRLSGLRTRLRYAGQHGLLRPSGPSHLLQRRRRRGSNYHLRFPRQAGGGQ